MGLSHAAAAEQAQRLHLGANESQAPPEAGHGRGRLVLHQVGGSPELRGIPLIGTGAGAIRGTRPGDSARELERAARDLNDSARLLVKQRMQAARERLN